jgi:serine/threonine protein kinase
MVKLCDFGFSKARSHAASTRTLLTGFFSLVRWMSAACLKLLWLARCPTLPCLPALLRQSTQTDSLPKTLLGTPEYVAPEVLTEGGQKRQVGWIQWTTWAVWATSCCYTCSVAAKSWPVNCVIGRCCLVGWQAPREVVLP